MFATCAEGRSRAPIDDGEVALLSRPEAELRLDVAAAFEALPPHYRDVALMRDVKEMTIDEIADALGATRQAVKARLHRARALMRESDEMRDPSSSKERME